MATKQDLHAGIFENHPEHFQLFTGINIASSELMKLDYSNKDIAIIGTDQFTVTQLDKISQHAGSVKVFQINPAFVMSGSDRILHSIINHPLIAKKRRLLNTLIKSLLFLRFLETQV